MSHAAARLFPDAQEYLTFDPEEPIVPTEFFINGGYFARTIDRLIQNGHVRYIEKDPREADVAARASEIYGMIVSAVQAASFIPRRNMAPLALQSLQDYLGNALVIDAAGDDDEAAKSFRAKAEQRNVLLKLVKAGTEDVNPNHYFTTLTPEIVAHAIRYGLDKALVEAGGLTLEKKEEPVPGHDMLVNVHASPDQARRLEELAVMTPAAKAALTGLLSQVGAALAEEDLRNLAEAALVCAQLSGASLMDNSLDFFTSHPYNEKDPSAEDRITMSTLNPIDWIEQVISRRSLGDGRLGFGLLTDPLLRQHVLSKIRRMPVDAERVS